jgi:DNA-binding transcriptional LysR family regulator
MRYFDPLSLQLFVAVCEEGSIALAAVRQGIVPSAISKRISALEQQIGSELLRRGRRGIALTPAGESLWRYSRDLLQTMDRMHGELGEYANGVQGHVRVFASMSAIAEFLPQDISVFLKKQDRVRVSLEEHVSFDVVRGVEDGRADLGVCWDAVDMRGLQTLPYRHDHLAVVVHPDHPLAKRKSTSFEDTIEFEHVDINAGGILQSVQQRHAALAGKTMRYRIQVSTVDAACRIVAANLAVAIVPREGAGALQQALNLRVIPLSNAWARRQFAICARDTTALSAPVRLLIESLRGGRACVPALQRRLLRAAQE